MKYLFIGIDFCLSSFSFVPIDFIKCLINLLIIALEERSGSSSWIHFFRNHLIFHLSINTFLELSLCEFEHCLVGIWHKDLRFWLLQEKKALCWGHYLTSEKSCLSVLHFIFSLPCCYRYAVSEVSASKLESLPPRSFQWF